MPEQQIMLSLFDESTIMARPWAEAGYLCYCVDIQNPRTKRKVRPKGHTPDPDNKNIIRVRADILDWLPPDGEIVFSAFFPPCTDLASSGAWMFKDKGIGRAVRALALFKRCADLGELFRCPYLIENPVGTASTYWREPDYKFDPCDYGDPWTKNTCLWTGGGFVMPPKKRVKPTQGSKAHKEPPGEERAKNRSKTPEGFARAVFEANRPLRDRMPSSGWLARYRKSSDLACVVTGDKFFVGKTYLKPLPTCTAAERNDPFNEIILTGQLAALLDLGLLSFTDDGRVLVSERLGAEERRYLALPHAIRQMWNPPAAKYFHYHRENVFSG